MGNTVRMIKQRESWILLMALPRFWLTPTG